MNKKELDLIKRIFGKRIFDLRTGKALSLRNMSARCDLDNSKISKIEKGMFNVTLSTIVELARGLGIHPAELLKGLPG